MQGLDPFARGKIANMHAEVGQAYADAGLPREAIAEYEKAVALCPQFADLRTQASARSCARVNDFAARARAVRSRDRGPAELRAGAHPARRDAALAGRAATRREQWKKALEIEPDNVARQDVPARPRDPAERWLHPRGEEPRMTSAIDEAKRAAARAALSELPHEGVIGLGTGSTTRFFIDEVGALVRAGRRLVGVPTSEKSRLQAESLGIPLLGDEGPWDIAVTVDGADEVDPALDLIKGGGGAQTREKIVNDSSKRNVIIVDEAKLSKKLGEKWKVPIEVLRFAHLSTRAKLARFGVPEQRRKDDAPFITDAGNFIYDLAAGTIDDPRALDASLRAIPGVVETGLFVARADVVLVAGSGGVKRLVRR